MRSPHIISSLAHLRRDERGIELLQFAIVIPILMFLTLAVVDLARYMAIEAILTKGAEDGLNLAVKIPNLDVDYRGLPPTDANYRNYAEARRRVLEAALRLPLATLVTAPDVQSASQLNEYEMTDTGLDVGAGPLPTVRSGVALLRPGERVLNVTKNLFKEHEKLPSVSGTPPPQPPEVLMKSYPIQIILTARVDMFTPWIFGPKEARGIASGYREMFIPQGPIPITSGGGTEIEVPTPGPTPPALSVTTTTTTTVPGCNPAWNVKFSDTASRTEAYCPNSVSGFGGFCNSVPCP